MPSETGGRGHARNDPAEAAVRAQLESMLASSVFARSPQLRSFLSYIVERRLAGQGHTLKESVLARELYGKGPDFDGGSDPVVRVDARRLRDKLREFYEGRTDSVVISLPKGSYVPFFEEVSAAQAEPASPLAVTERKERSWGVHLGGQAALLGALALAALVGTTAIAWRALRPQEPAKIKMLPLASYPGAEGSPALSPDGNFVAFAWSGQAEPGPADIYVKAVGTEALRRLTDTPASEANPAWSPDGGSIAFVRDGRGVVVMSQLGGSERQVSASGTHVAWAADSKSVLIRDREANTGPFGIFQVSLDTLERGRLTQAPVGIGDWRFDVSPDGRTLAFIRYERPGIADLHVVAMHGGEPRRLTNWNAGLTGLAWTPDGREIVFSVEQSSAARLWRINVNTSRPGRGTPIPDIPAAAVMPSISRPKSGLPARLAFQTITRDVDIHLMDLEAPLLGGRIESRPFSRSTRVESSARFSPDGSRIAFVSDRSGEPEIWVGGRDGSGIQQVTTLGASQLVVGGWSPDGARIVFDAAIVGNSDIYVVGADGGHLRRLTSEPSVDGIPSWSGDGRWVYFASTRAGVIPDVWRVSADGGPAMRLTRNGGFEPRESPDGQYLFYLDRAPVGLPIDGSASVMRVPLAGGHEQQVVERVRPFLWSVTDMGIVFVTREPDFDAIDLYRFGDQRVTRVGRLGFRVPGTYTHMTASRDGRWALATEMVRYDADLLLLDNFQ